MITQRFNANPDWNIHYNNSFYGLVSVTEYVRNKLGVNLNMIEIGAYMGESTFIFASSRIFNKIHTIEPHSGNEEFNEMFGYDWDLVKKEFVTNLRFFKNIKHYSSLSQHTHQHFADGEFDFIYIDGLHTYEAVKQDIELYLPKLKKGGIIGGHDYYKYQWPNVVNE